MSGKRITIVSLFVLLFVLGLPIWWKTTTTYRSDVDFTLVHRYVRDGVDSMQWPLFREFLAHRESYYSTRNSKDIAFKVKTAAEYVLTFTLLNSDPHTIIPKWQFPKLYNAHLKPFIDQISVTANFTTQSKVSHYATLMKPPKFDPSTNSYYIPYESLSEYINPNEWNLDTVSTNQPTLNFIIYIPPPHQSPLYIRGSSTSGNKKEQGIDKNTAFMIPQWGGIIIHNNQHTEKDIEMINSQHSNDQDTNINKMDSNNNNEISNINVNQNNAIDITNELNESMVLFRYQLQVLMGIDQPSSKSNQQSVTIDKKQLNSLIVRCTADNLNITLDTLNSLSSMIDSLPNMLVLDNIKEKVGLAINQIDQAHQALSRQDHRAALAASKIALVASEEAFFDKNMLSQLYFPDEHKYAVYTPLFVPVCFPIISGIIQEVNNWRKKKRERKQQQTTNKNSQKQNSTSSSSSLKEKSK